ncbi:RseA family anti-sigma factor [Methylibium sp.]|uniref:sigma-E factor negative regulatory protein n=1 Tax=Methylibium sp. TaxID=2067992 RepID=UPI00286CA4C8|nr:RseA family anti-sigma factor [Methylibium sp.]
MDDKNKFAALEALSALADGEADASTAATVSVLWRNDARMRERWHRYQLIGDAMRSDELGGRGDDAEFVSKLRARLAQEPVVLAPAAMPTTARNDARRASGVMRRWAPPAAIAAGFLAVAGALTVTRLSTPPPAGPPLALAPVAATAQSAAPAVVVQAPIAAPTVAVADVQPERVAPSGRVIRDARLDQYLAAHKQFGGSSALGVPSGFLRSATFEDLGTVGGSR